MAGQIVGAIQTEAEYEQALDEVEVFFDNEPAPGTAEAKRFDLPARAIEVYEAAHWPVDPELVDAERTERMMAKRTTHRSTTGTKLYAVRDEQGQYAVRDEQGQFEDIQTYKRAHGQDVKRSSKAERAAKEAKDAKKKT